MVRPTRSRNHSPTLSTAKQSSKAKSSSHRTRDQSMRALFDKDGSDKLHGTETVDTYAVPDGDDDASLDLSSLELDQKRGDMDRSNHTSFSNHWDESQEETNQRRKRLERMREERDMQVRMIQMNKALEESNKTSVFGQKLNQLFGSSLPNLDVSFSVRASGSLNDLEGPLGVAFGKSRPRKTLLDLGGGSMRDLFTIQQDQESTEYDTSNASKPGPLSRLMAKRNNFNNLSDEPANTSGEEVKEGSKSPKTTPKKKRFDDLSGDEDAMQDSASSLPSLNLLGADDFEVCKSGSTRHREVSPRGRQRKDLSPAPVGSQPPQHRSRSSPRRPPRRSRMVRSTVSNEIAKGVEQTKPRRRGRSPKSVEKKHRRRTGRTVSKRREPEKNRFEHRA